jgi:hypothetical protein
MTTMSHWQMRQEKLSETLYEVLNDKLSPQHPTDVYKILTPQIATHALKAVLNQLANFYEADSAKKGLLEDLASRRYTPGGPNMPTLYIQEIANPEPPLTPKQELIKNFAEELGITEASVRILLNQYDKLPS